MGSGMETTMTSSRTNDQESSTDNGARIFELHEINMASEDVLVSLGSDLIGPLARYLKRCPVTASRHNTIRALGHQLDKAQEVLAAKSSEQHPQLEDLIEWDLPDD